MVAIPWVWALPIPCYESFDFRAGTLHIQLHPTFVGGRRFHIGGNIGIQAAQGERTRISAVFLGENMWKDQLQPGIGRAGLGTRGTGACATIADFSRQSSLHFDAIRKTSTSRQSFVCCSLNQGKNIN